MHCNRARPVSENDVNDDVNTTCSRGKKFHHANAFFLLPFEVQVISLLAALFGKTGTGKDASDLQRRGRLISQVRSIRMSLMLITSY